MSVYRVLDVIGTSTKSWEDAAATAVKTAGQTLRDLRVAEVVEQDLHIEEEGGEIIFRTKLRLSFKYDVAHAHVHQWTVSERLIRPSAGSARDIAWPWRC
jgi:dodecin